MTKSKQELLVELHLELQHHKRYQDVIMTIQSQKGLCEGRIWKLKQELDKLEREETPVRRIVSTTKRFDPWKVLGIEREEWDELLRERRKVA